MQSIYEMRPPKEPVSGGMHNRASCYRRGDKRLATAPTLGCYRSLFFFFGRQEECSLPSHSHAALAPTTLAANRSEATTSSNFSSKMQRVWCAEPHLGVKPTSSVQRSWQQYQCSKEKNATNLKTRVAARGRTSPPSLLPTQTTEKPNAPKHCGENISAQGLQMYQETVMAREGERYANNATHMHTCLHRKAVKARTTSLFTETYGTPKSQCGTSRAALQGMPDARTWLIKTVRGTKKSSESGITQPQESSAWSKQKKNTTVYVFLLQTAACRHFVPRLEKRDRGAPSQTKSGESLGQRRSPVFDTKQTKLRGSTPSAFSAAPLSVQRATPSTGVVLSTPPQTSHDNTQRHTRVP